MAALTVTTTVVKSPNAQISSGVLGSAVTATAGQYVYVDTSASPNVLRLSVANSTAAAAVCNGVLLTGGTAGQTVLYETADPVLIPGITGMTTGSPVYISTTAGSITSTSADLSSGNYKTIVGQITAATTINFAPMTPVLLP